MSKSMVRLSRGIVAVVAAAVALSFLALPAYGKAAAGTASINVRNVLAGSAEEAFTVTVNNPATSGQSIATPVNLVQVIAPSSFTPVNLTAPDGWTGSFDPTTRQVIFETGNSTDQILPGRSEQFSFTANVARPAADLLRTWRVATSDNAGRQLTTASASSDGALGTTIRVLRAVSLELTAPAATVDNTVTEQQANTKGLLRVQNAGSGTLTVTPSVAYKSGSSNVTISGLSAKSMGPRSEDTFPFNVAFGPVGNVVMTGDASATGADAFAVDSASITVQDAAEFLYESDSLSPRLVIPGLPYAFSLALDKNSADVGVNLNAATTLFRFAGGAYTSELDTAGDLSAGNKDAVPFTFVSDVVPTSIADGNYAPQVVIRGTDTNGAPVQQTVGVTNTVILDRIAPIIRPTLTPPASQVEGEAPATTNGATLEFGGTVQDPDGTPCGSDDCPISGAVLRQYSGGAAIGDIPVTVNNSNGTLTGSYEGNYATGTTAVDLIVNGADGAGNPGNGVSNRVPVDLVAPRLTGGTTGGGTSDRRTITVNLSERVAARGLNPADFIVDNHTVIAAAPAAGQTTQGFNQVVLTTGENLGLNEEPVVNYRPTELTRANDRVGIDLANQTITAADRIVPGLPALDSISGLGRQDGQFFSNDSTPDFTISSVTPGDRVTVFRDSNGNGQLNPGADEELGSKQVAPGASTVVVTSKDLGTVNATFGVFIRAVDPRLNVGPAATEILSLDFIAPVLQSAVQAGATVNLTFTDVLVRGRDFAIDWVVRDASETYSVAEVLGTGNTRALDTDDPAIEETNLTQVVFSYKGPAGQRYQDRAGNDLANFAGSVS